MFYSNTILARKGPLASIWLAAHCDRRLTKHQIMVTDVSGSLKDVLAGGLPPMALRLSSQLLLGASKIYNRKARYLLDDCTDALSRLRLTSTNTAKDVDLPAEQTRAAPALISITKPPQPTLMEDDYSFDLEGFLNAPIESALNDRALKKATASTKDMLSPMPPHSMRPMSFGGGAGDDLMHEFAGLMGEDVDVEVGRRQSEALARGVSDVSMLSPPELPRAVDEGMEDELRSLQDSLPFSPLKAVSVRDSENIANHNDNTNNNNELPLSSPPSSIKRKRQPAGDMTKRRRRVTLLVDDETELSNSQFQAQIRDTDDITLGTQDLPEGSAAASMSPAVDINDLLSRPGALLGGMVGSDLTSLFAATCKLNASPKPQRQPTMDEPLATLDGPEMMSDGQHWMHDDAEDTRQSLPTIHTSPVSQHPAPPAQSQPAQLQVDAASRWRQVFGDRQSSIQLSSVAQTRKDAAEAFYQVLVLASKGMLTAEQSAPFEAIAVSPTVTLCH